MVVTGAKSEDDSKLASRKYARIIQKLGFNAKFTDFKIQNIVGSCDIKFPIRLEGLASRHHNFSSYEPELFPGLIYRMMKPKIVLLIFVSGKIVLTGAKVREEIYQAFEMIYPVLSGMFLVSCSRWTLANCSYRLPQGLRLCVDTPSTGDHHQTYFTLLHYLVLSLSYFLLPGGFEQDFVPRSLFDFTIVYASIIRRSSDSKVVTRLSAFSRSKITIRWSHTAGIGGGTVRWSNGCLLNYLPFAY